MESCRKFVLMFAFICAKVCVSFAALSLGQMTETSLTGGSWDPSYPVEKANGFYWVYWSQPNSKGSTILGWSEDWGGDDYYAWEYFPCVYSSTWGGSSANTIWSSIEGVKGRVVLPTELGGKPLTEISDCAFLGLKDITEVVIPATVTYLYCGHYQEEYYDEEYDEYYEAGYYGGAFSGCTGLISVTVPSGQYSLGQWFPNSSKIRTVVIAPGSNAVCENFANGWSQISSISIPESVNRIHKGAFVGCTGLGGGIAIVNNCIFPISTSYTTSLSIGANIKVIADDIWAYCPNLQNVSLSTKNDNFKLVGPLLCTADGKGIIACTDKNVEMVEIPDGVTNIGDYAFCDCKQLNAISIPVCLRSIGGHAFQGCGGLSSITIPESVTEIGNAAFSGCSSLESATIPAGVKNVGDYVFNECHSLISLTLHSGVTDIGNYAFNGCKALASLTLPNGVTSVGDYAFKDCTSLKTVKIPASVISYRVSTHAFDGCCAITEATVPGWKCRIDFTNVTKLLISDGTVNIGSLAFSECPNLTSVEMPSSVTSIGSYAFGYCAKLSVMKIPSSVTHVDSTAFKDCTGLVRVSVPPCVSKVSTTFPSAYQNLQDIVFDYGVTSVSDDLIAGCRSLVSISIPSSVTNLSTSALADCELLECVNVDERNETYNSCGEALYNKKASELTFCVRSKVGVFVVESGTRKIAESACADCVGLTSVEIPASVTSIGDNAFSGCSNISSVTIPSCVTKISKTFPASCQILKALVLDEGVTSVSADLLAGCRSLESIEIPSSVTSMSAESFLDCPGLSNIDVNGQNDTYCLLDGVLYDKKTFELVFCLRGKVGEVAILADTISIGPFAFSGCTGLTSVEIPSSVTTIGSHAFSDCSALLSVKLPPNMNIIASSTFSGCVALATVGMPLNVTSIGSSAFSGCKNLTAMQIPSSVKSIDSKAFYGCGKLADVTFLGDAPLCATDAFNGTSAGIALHAAPSTSGWLMWNGLRVAYDGGATQPTVATEVAITVTNVVVNYIVNSIQPSFALPATYDTGFVNVIAEVKGGCVAVPATWTVNYPKFTEKFGSDFTKALAMKTGKKDGAGNPMFVWQDYVAGTDPTKEDDVFTASITIVDGEVKVSYTPELDDARKSLRKYTTWGKKSLLDTGWTEVELGKEADYNFFKVTVEMK